MIKSRRVRWAEHAARMGSERERGKEGEEEKEDEEEEDEERKERRNTCMVWKKARRRLL
jgi:hypothetical protein